ncbi:MAG: hypothetical protein R3F62_24615 [Planctomycetota bacterium]
MAFDGAPACEAARRDPRVLVLGHAAQAHAAVRLPDNAQRIEVEVLDGGEARLVILARMELWRGEAGVVVASWDPSSGTVEHVLETWNLDWGDFTWEVGSGTRPACGIRREVEGVAIDFIPMGNESP